MSAEAALERITSTALPAEIQPPALTVPAAERAAGHTPANEDSAEHFMHCQVRLLQNGFY